MNLTDIGANLTHSSFHDDLDAVLSRASGTGISTIVVTGTTVLESEMARDIAERCGLHATAGVHPHHARDCGPATIGELREIAKHPRVVAIGECGLDFNRNYSPHPSQEQWFVAQIELGLELGMPLFLHSRDAHPRFAEILRHHRVKDAVAHCFTGEKDELHAVRALTPDVAIVHLQRADCEGNAHCWGNFGIMIEAVRAARRVIVVAEEIVDADVIASDPNRTVIPGFLVSAVVECRYGAHPSPVQGCYGRDNAFFRQYHEQTKTQADSDAWLQRWVHGFADRQAYMNQLGGCRVEDLGVKQHAYAAQADFGY